MAEMLKFGRIAELVEYMNQADVGADLVVDAREMTSDSGIGALDYKPSSGHLYVLIPDNLAEIRFSLEMICYWSGRKLVLVKQIEDFQQPQSA